MLKNNSVGNILKEARKSNGYTQQQLADKYLSDRQLISNYERGISIPNAESFILLLDILNTPVLIENGEAKIMEVQSMSNTNKESRDLRMEYLNFNLDTLLEKHYEQKESVKQDCINKYSDICNLAKEKGLEVYHGYGFTDDMWHMDFSKEGIAFSISKDNKEIQVVVEKSGRIDIFDLETFIKDIKDNLGEGVGTEIYKILTFNAYTFSLGRDILQLFEKITKGLVKDDSEISKLLPMTEDFKHIIFNQLISKNYIEEIHELNLPQEDVPVSYLLSMYDEYQSNNVWIKLVLDDYEEVYEPDSFDNGIIADACEYAVNIFDKFDELFEEWQEQ